MHKYRLIGAFERAYDPVEGNYITLDEPLFGIKACLTGLFEPQKFDEAIGFKILFEEPHQPERIPVLLIHGHVTGPRAMENVGASIDRSRFEPWYAYFPAGYNLDTLGDKLRAALSEAVEREGVSQVAIVTYSLGGLVVRSALQPHDDGHEMPDIPVFIAASTPWAGTWRLGAWAWAVDAPASWKDMKPGSDFLVHLLDDPLPGETRLHVMAGSGGNSRMVYGEDDTVVEVQALLTDEVLDEAESVMFWDYLTHFDMVSHPEPLARINDLLDAGFPEAAP